MEAVCPACGHDRTWVHGTNRGQKRLPRRRCPRCGVTFTVGGPIVGHRPPLGERAMTRAEIMRRYRQRRRLRLAAEGSGQA